MAAVNSATHSEPMTEDELSLLSRIEQFQLDDPTSQLTFSDRLAQENGWSKRHTDRVVEEYRRFVFLTAVAGHHVTPSHQVDQAWHLHLLHTRSYWDDLCGDVLGSPLHHEPTKGGAAEEAKHHEWYGRTLASYQRLFGHEPPADIWPSASGSATIDRAEPVNAAAHRIIAKPAWLRGVISGDEGRSSRRTALLAAGLALILATAGVLASGTWSTLFGDEGTGPGFSWLNAIIGAGVIALIVASLVWGSLTSGGKRGAQDLASQGHPESRIQCSGACGA